MRTEFKAGLIFVGVGCLLFVNLIFLLVRFAVGGAHNPPLSSPLRELVLPFFILGIYWWVFAVIGVVLIIYGLIQRVRDEKKDMHA